MVTRPYTQVKWILSALIAFAILQGGQGFSYNKSWDQGHLCTNTLPGATGWGRYAYETTSPTDYLGGYYISKECCEALCKVCPVYASTGRLQMTFVDLSMPGVGPSLTVTRTYQSQDWATTLFGRGWLFNLGRKLTILRSREGDKQVAVRRDTGEINFFKENPDGTLELLAEYGVTYQLTKNADATYTIAEKNGTVQHISADGKPLRIIDKNGNPLTFEYNTVGCLSRITNASGNYVDFTLGPNGKIASIADNLGRTIQYTYDTNGNLISSSDPMGNATQYVYDTQNRLTSITDPRGNTILAVTYDSFQPPRVATMTEKGETWTIAYHDGYTVKTDSSGQAWTYYFNNLGIIERVIDPLGHEKKQSPNKVTSTSLEWEEDGNGNRTTYTYDADGNIKSKADPLGNTWQYTYVAGTNRVETETNPLGVVTKYEYDADGNLIKLTRDFGGPLQNATTYTYDAKGNRTGMTDAMGNTTAYQYDAAGNLVKTTNALSNVTTYTYDNRGNRLTETDALGRTTTYVYDLMNRLVTTTDALGNTTAYVYDGNGNRTSATDAKGNTTQFAYDIHDRLVQVIDPLGNTTQYTYDSRNNRTSVTNANGNTTTYVYDAANRLVKKTNAVGEAITYIYDLEGNLLSITDPCSNTTSYTYDALDRNVNIKDPLGNQTILSYDSIGRIVSMTDAAGHTQTSAYDSLNRMTGMTDQVGRTWAYTYNAVDLKTGETTPYGNTIRYSYDGIRRLIGESDSLGTVQTITYDAVGNVLTKRDGEGNVYAYQYDTVGRCTKKTDPLGNDEQLSYDEVQNLVKFTNKDGGVFSYVYDARGNMTQQTDPAGSTTNFAYDAIGQRIGVTDALGRTTSYSYDAAGRLSQIGYANGTSESFVYNAGGKMYRHTNQMGDVIEYAYDGVGHLVKIDYPGTNDSLYSYNNLGLLVNAKNEVADILFAYNATGQVTQVNQNGYVIAYAYDYGANSQTINYPSGMIVTRRLDIRNRLSTVQTGAGGSYVSYAYEPDGQVDQESLGNGLVVDYTHDSGGQLTYQRCSLGGHLLFGFEHQYDKRGNRLFTKKQHSVTTSEVYQYDNMSQVVDFKLGQMDGSNSISSPTTHKVFTLDPVGNWSQWVSDGATETRTHNQMNELTNRGSVSLSYNANGNLVDDEVRLYTYDTANNLIGVNRKSDGSTVATFKYDALGRRIEKEVSGVKTTYIYDDIRIIETRNSGATTTYVHGRVVDEIIAMEGTGGRVYYVFDSLGSTAALTDTTGQVVETYGYGPYGETKAFDQTGTQVTSSAYSSCCLFQGREWDQETDLYYYRARHYSPELGRFLQRDPLGYVDGLNLYLFVGNNPINNSDPSGTIIRSKDCIDDYLVANGIEKFTGSSSGGQHTYNGANSLVHKNDSLTAEILYRMLRSSYQFDFSSLDVLKKDIKAREGIVQAAKTATFHFPSDSTDYKANLTYWSNNYLSSIKSGVTASSAIQDIWNNPSQYKMMCYAAASVVLLKGLIQGLGDAEFNSRVGSSPIQNYASWRLERNTNDEFDWVPGDWGYVDNTTPDDEKDAGLEGENIIYLGGTFSYDSGFKAIGNFWGHPGGVKTLQDWFTEVDSWTPAAGDVSLYTTRRYLKIE